MAEDRFRYKPFKKKPNRFFEVTATVLFIDIVRFTKQGDNEVLRDAVRRLQNTLDDVLVQLDWDLEQGSNDAIMIPTGDGYGIGFEPTRVKDTQVLNYASVISKKFKNLGMPVRMGINNGPCWIHQDLNAQLNLAGWGIIDAARAMACGGENHILCTEGFAGRYNQQKHDPDLHPVGSYTFKDRKLELFNYFSKKKGFGNPDPPKKSNI